MQKKKPSLSKNEKEALKKLKLEIEQYPGASYLVKKLCVTVSMDRNKLYYGFKKISSHTIHQYIIFQRIKRARQLLRNSDKPIKAIASDCGYKNVKNFHTAFKKLTGKTALAYRKRR